MGRALQAKFSMSTLRKRLPLLLVIGFSIGSAMEYMMIRMGFYQGVQKRQLQLVQELQEARQRIKARQDSQ